MKPTIKRILYATDLSDTARHALGYAAVMGEKFGAEVTVVHVVPDLIEIYSMGSGMEVGAYLPREDWEKFQSKGITEAQESLKKRVEEVCDLEYPGENCPLSPDRARVAVGNPVDRIVELASSGSFDLVVMGTHGHGKIEEFILGSVATGVIRRCPVPVTVVRLPAKD